MKRHSACQWMRSRLTARHRRAAARAQRRAAAASRSRVCLIQFAVCLTGICFVHADAMCRCRVQSAFYFCEISVSAFATHSWLHNFVCAFCAVRREKKRLDVRRAFFLLYEPHLICVIIES